MFARAFREDVPSRVECDLLASARPPRRRSLLPERGRRPRLPGRLAAHPGPAERRRDLLDRDHRGRLHGGARTRQPRGRRALREALAASRSRHVRTDRDRHRRLGCGERSPALRRALAPPVRVVRPAAARGARAVRVPDAADVPDGDVAAVPGARAGGRDGGGRADRRVPLRPQHAGRGDRRAADALGARALPRDAHGAPLRGRRQPPGGPGRAGAPARHRRPAA